ncbi:MAG: hypothetical protein ACYDAD_15115 [Acidimicrobiales bacterium]
MLLGLTNPTNVSPSDFGQAGTVAAVIIVAAATAAGLRVLWRILRYSVRTLEALEEIMREFRPNGGFSVKDQLVTAAAAAELAAEKGVTNSEDITKIKRDLANTQRDVRQIKRHLELGSSHRAKRAQ